MTENNNQEIDVPELMAKIRKAAEKRKSNSTVLYRLLKTNGGSGASQNGFSAHQPGTILPVSLQPKFEPQEQYHINDLLPFHDQTFVRNAYEAILKRDPDDAGFVQYLEKLRSGQVSKVDILASLRFSREGRLKNVKIDGLTVPRFLRRLYRVPFLGYVIELGVTLVRLPSFVASYRRLEAYSAAQLERIAEHTNALTDNLSNELEEIRRQNSETLRKIRNNYQQQINAQREQTQQLFELQRDLQSHVVGTQDQLRERARAQELQYDALQQTRRDLSLQESRLTHLLEEVGKRSPLPLQREQLESLAEEKDHMLDGLYASLEDRFRGRREDIKQLLRFYLPFLKEAGITTNILDVGCGRGEWLEVLKEAGLSGRGIDFNRVMIEQCSGLGLDAFEGEALAYLQQQEDQSLNCITAFHFVEHQPLNALVQFLDETARTLKPGGLLILETPNPENVLVGSCNFYLDPTHRNPIPIPTMQFLLECKGFSRLQILRLHPMTSATLEGKDDLSQHLNTFFFGPMDYAILGRKI